MFHFRGDPVHVACLEAAGIQMVSLANNHVLDFPTEELRAMLTVLDAHHIAHAGAGPDLDDDAVPLCGEKAGRGSQCWP